MTNKIGLFTALISFLIGTILLIIFYLTNSTSITIYGMIFIAVAGIINLGVFVKVLINLINEKENRKKYILTSGIMLLNIPIVILYFYIVMFLMSTMRITFINETGTKLTNLKIIGGETKIIKELGVGERQTEWIGIKFENDFILEYKIDGEIKREMVYSYAVTGDRINHRIGNKSDRIEKVY
jgi:hypothetical protein